MWKEVPGAGKRRPKTVSSLHGICPKCQNQRKAPSRGVGAGWGGGRGPLKQWGECTWNGSILISVDKEGRGQIHKEGIITKGTESEIHQEY